MFTFLLLITAGFQGDLIILTYLTILWSPCQIRESLVNRKLCILTHSCLLLSFGVLLLDPEYLEKDLGPDIHPGLTSVEPISTLLTIG